MSCQPADRSLGRVRHRVVEQDPPVSSPKTLFAESLPPPKRLFGPPLSMERLAECDAIRRRSIGAEADLSALGTLAIFFCAPVFLLFALSLLKAEHTLESLLVALTVCAVSGMAIYGGYQLRKLRPVGRLVGTVFSVFLLAACSLGFTPIWFASVFGLFFLWLAWGERGRTIFSEQYQREIVPATGNTTYGLSEIYLLVPGAVSFLFVVAILSRD